MFAALHSTSKLESKLQISPKLIKKNTDSSLIYAHYI